MIEQAMFIPSICPTIFMVKKRQNLMLYQGVPVRFLHHFRNGSIKLSSGEVVSKYLLDEELQIIPGVL